jgi:hypothetical protein
MKIFNKIIHSPFIYPFFLAVYPILALWNTNFDRINAVEIVIPLATTLVVTLVVFLLLRLILCNWSQAALLTSLLVLLFFTYGHIFNLLLQYAFFDVREGRPRNLVVVWLLILLVGCYLIFRYGKRTEGLNQYLNYVCLALVIMTGIQIGFDQIHAENIKQNLREAANSSIGSDPVTLVSNGNSPDVYLIILDGYLRDDILQRSFNFDNSDFLKQLTDLGFVIPSCTQSNYTWTRLSVSSELNMNYLDTAGINLDPSIFSPDFTPLTEITMHSMVRANFLKMGYKMVAFDTAIKYINISDADIFIHGKTNFWQELLDASEFNDMLTQTSILRLNGYLEIKYPALTERIGQVLDAVSSATVNKLVQTRSVRRLTYDAIMNELDKVTSVPDIPGKKFTYMHVLAPHKTVDGLYILGPDGGLRPTRVQDVGYSNGVTYLNKRIIPILKTLITKSARPPIIILQGDHGWKYSPTTRPFILNAYYLPDGGDKIIYPSITPVNTFRSIFNYYFRGNYPQLKNTTYYSEHDYPYKFTEVPVVCPRPSK